jgi:DNA-binding NarL/FixJ family response regulator
MKRIVIADDHSIVRQAVSSLLSSNGYEVLGEASNSDEAISLVHEMKPDILLTDIGLPQKSGIELAFELKSSEHPTLCVNFTMYQEEARVRQAVSAGIRGYILKTEPPQEILRLLDEVSQGQLALSGQFSSIREELEELASQASKNGSHYEDLDPLSKLSKREREIFFLIADGKPNRVIAKRLFISPRTVETHRARVIKKLGFESTADLIRYSIKNSLITL